MDTNGFHDWIDSLAGWFEQGADYFRGIFADIVRKIKMLYGEEVSCILAGQNFEYSEMRFAGLIARLRQWEILDTIGYVQLLDFAGWHLNGIIRYVDINCDGLLADWDETQSDETNFGEVMRTMEIVFGRRDAEDFKFLILELNLQRDMRECIKEVLGNKNLCSRCWLAEGMRLQGERLAALGLYIL